MDEQQLAGGVANAGQVTRSGGHVLRPSGPYSGSVRALFALVAGGRVRGRRIELSNPFHLGPADTYQAIASQAEPVSHPATAGEPSFTAAIRHINAVLAGQDEPRLLAVDTALPAA